MITIRLEQEEWRFDPKDPLAPPGGFGRVYRGQSATGDEVAVKRLEFSAAEVAQRELKLAVQLRGRSCRHIIPILDSGHDSATDQFYIVMAVAQMSLAEYIADHAYIEVPEAMVIFREIAIGLGEISDIVHRDLKPANVLFHEGKWKISDFGIGRFAEKSTSDLTLKDCRTPAYAAPEQWRGLRATNETDIYALGCIGYALLTGKPPFTSSDGELREQHLTKEPPKIPHLPAQVRSLLIHALRKDPSTRPNVQRMIGMLDNFLQTISEGDESAALQELAAAESEHVTQVAREEASRHAEREEGERRARIAESGRKIYAKLTGELFDRILDHAPSAKMTPPNQMGPVLQIQLGSGVIRCEFITREGWIPQETFEACHWDVIAAAKIEVVQGGGLNYRCGSSLWYCKRSEKASYRWLEVSYMCSPLVPGNVDEPFAMDNFNDAALAAGSGLQNYQLAGTPQVIDDEDFPNFCERWIQLLAKAARGRLSKPRYLPISR